MKKIKKISKAEMLKMKIGATRNSQKEQGYFDGRFVQRAIVCKKIYNRKRKNESDQLDKY